MEEGMAKIMLYRYVGKTNKETNKNGDTAVYLFSGYLQNYVSTD